LKDTLSTILDTKHHPYGFRSTWVDHLREHILERMADFPPTVLTPPEAEEVYECTGLWLSRQLENRPVWGVHHNGWQWEFTRLLVRRWLAQEPGAEHPRTFVREHLNDLSWLPNSELHWLSGIPNEVKTELATELTVVLLRMGEQLDLDNDDRPIRIGLDNPTQQIGPLTLTADDVDFQLGEHQSDGEGAWPGTVLIGLVGDQPTQRDLERLGFSALMHALDTGCPPARIVAYGLFSGQKLHQDVDADWLRNRVGHILSTVSEITEFNNFRVIRLTPGHHCFGCTEQRDCPEFDPEDGDLW
jgi:hypothetical protein